MEKNKIANVFVAMMLALMFTSVVSANVNMLSNESLSSEIDSILSSGKKVFLFFHTDWCHFCQQQKPVIDELEQGYAENIAFFHVDCEEHPEAMREFGVSVYPAMFLIMDKGEDGQYESQYFRGFTDKETLKKSIDWVIGNRSINENSMRLPLRLSGFSSVVLNDGETKFVALARAASEETIIPIESTCPFSPPGVTSQHHWFWIPGDPLCRGACGRNCPGTCNPLPDISICGSDGEYEFGCKYTVIECISHQGCREHDNCFDDCAINNPSWKCYHRCNLNCIKNFGWVNCGQWLVGRGSFDSKPKFSSSPIQTWCVGSRPYCVDGECVECRTNADCDQYDRAYCENNMLKSEDYWCNNGLCSFEKKIVADCSVGGGYCIDLTKKCVHIPKIPSNIPPDIPNIPNVPEPPKIPSNIPPNVPNIPNVPEPPKIPPIHIPHIP